jgi:PAS domain S-box-containing protein
MRFSLGFRVFLGFLIINLLYILILIVALIRLSDMGEKSRVFSNVYLPIYKYIQRIESSRNIQHEELKKSLELKEKDEKLNSIRAYASSFANTNNELLTRIKSLLNIFERLMISTGEEKSYRQLQDRLKSVEQKSEQYLRSIDKLVESIQLDIYPGPIDYWVPVENSENILRKEQKIFIMQIEGLMRSLITRIESEENSIRWQLIIFTILAFVISVLVLLSIERRLSRIVRFSSKMNSMIMRHQFEPIRVPDEDEISDLINNVNNLTIELLNIQKETEENRNQLILLNTNLRKLNSELEYIKSFNESIINSIKISILVLNEKLQIIKYNPVSESMLGLNEAQLQKNFCEVFQGISSDSLKESLNRALYENKMSILQEVEFRRGDSRQILDIIISPFLGESREIKGILLMVEDRTENVRTRKLLEQSERLATIGRMSAQLTHQIKNPLSTIGLNLDMLTEDMESGSINRDSFVKRISIIKGEIENLIHLSNEYLRFANISDVVIEGIDINNLIQSIVDLYQIECQNNRISVELNLSRSIPEIKGNKNELKQAIVNVFVNAMESLMNGGKILIKTYESEGSVFIEISDTGEGIDEDIIPHIFDPFYSTKEGGVGLGLSISAQIIEQMGGKIACKNNPDKGVTFTFRLPI